MNKYFLKNLFKNNNIYKTKLYRNIQFFNLSSTLSKGVKKSNNNTNIINNNKNEKHFPMLDGVQYPNKSSSFKLPTAITGKESENTGKNYNKYMEKVKEEELLALKNKNSNLDKIEDNIFVENEDDNSILYYELLLREDFLIFNLRNFYYSYLLAKKTKGKLYINIDDSGVSTTTLKNKKLKEFLEVIDYLGLNINILKIDSINKNKELSFNEIYIKDNFEKLNKEENNDLNKITHSIFQSDRKITYAKYIQFLLDVGTVYMCYCSSFEKCSSNCKTNIENSKQINFLNDLLNNSKSFKVKYLRVNIDVAYGYIKTYLNNIMQEYNNLVVNNINKEALKYTETINKINSLNTNLKEVIIPNINRSEYQFCLNDLGDFPIYKNFSKEISPSFKSTVDDHIHNVNNKIENKEYSVEKDFVLTNILEFKNKRYTHLPDIKLFYWSKSDFPSLEVAKLIKDKKILPEAILNCVLVLGWGHSPVKEMIDKQNNKNSKNMYFNKLITKDKAIEVFNTTNIYVYNAIFSSDMLYFFNNKYLNYYFFKLPNELYFTDIVNTYKAMKWPNLFKQEFYNVFVYRYNKDIGIFKESKLTKNLKSNKKYNKYKKQDNNNNYNDNTDINIQNKLILDSWTDKKWRKVIKVVIPNIKSFEYLYLYYFLIESPLYNSEFVSKHNKIILSFFDNKKKAAIYIHDLINIFESLNSEEKNIDINNKFVSKNINKRISEFMYNKFIDDSSEENNTRLLYKILKIIIADNTKINNIADVCDVIGKEETINRCKKFYQALELIDF